MSTRRVALALSGVLLVAACSSGDDGTLASNNSAPTTTVGAGEAATTTDVPDDTSAGRESSTPAAYDAIRLSVERATPFSRVGLIGLDDTASNLVAVFEFDNGTSWATGVLIDPDGPFIVAPALAPGTETSDMAVRISDGTVDGPSLEITIDATDARDVEGAFTATIDAMVDIVDEQAVAMQTSWPELSSMTTDSIRSDLVPLKTVQLLLDGGAGSARDLYDSSDGAGRAWLDQWAAEIDLSASFDPDRVEIPIVDQSEPAGFAHAVRSPAGRSRPAIVRPTAGGADCVPFYREDVQTAERLSQMMTNGAIGQIATTGEAGRILALFDMAIGVLGAIETAGTGQSSVSGAVGSLSAAWSMYHNMVAGVMPRSFTNIDVTMDTTDFEEDRIEPGKWTEVWVTARSPGYSLDGSILASIMNGIGGLWGDATGGQTSGPIGEAAAGFVPGEVNNALQSMLPPDGVISFCPQEWRVDIAGKDYSWARPLQALFSVDNDAQTYINETDVGRDTLRFAPLPEKFGGATVITDLNVETHAIDVDLGPSTIWVTNPGDEVPITAELEWGKVQTLAWLPEQGSWTDGIGADTNEPGTRVLKTPTDAGLFDFDVRVESTSRQGLRADNDPERYNFVRIRLSPFEIIPNPGNVEVRQPLQFAAVDRDGNSVDVVWSATGGDIDPDTGLYIAGERPGTYEVKATLRDNPEVFVTAPVNVGEFCLTGTWRVNGAEFARLLSEGGTTVTHTGGTWDITVAADRSFRSTINGFEFTMVADGREIKVRIDGHQDGNVIATATEITAVETTSRSLTVTGSAAGTSFTISPDDLPTGTDFGGGPYRCEDGQLIVDRDGKDFLYDKID